MSSADLHLISDWTLRAPQERVWDALMRPEAWPQWWPAVIRADVLDRGAPGGVGSRLAFEWKTALPYRLAFQILTTRVEPMTLIEGEASGALAGTGRWQVSATRGGTRVRYDWHVTIQAPGLRLVAPFAKKAFVWNHAVVMRQGQEGLARRLAAG